MTNDIILHQMVLKSPNRDHQHLHDIQLLSPTSTTATAQRPRTTTTIPLCSNYIRYGILLLSLLCLTSIMANIVAFNFSIMCMTKGQNDNTTNTAPVYDYSKNDQTILLSSVAIGALLAVLPMTVAIDAKGARLVFFGAGILTAVATALVPLAASQGVYYFVTVRILQGISFSACLPLAGDVTARWATLHQNGLFMSLLTGFPQLASAFAMPLSGMLCVSQFGWPAVYYVHAIISAILFIAWLLIYRNTPDNHPCVTGMELELIQCDKHKENADKKQRTSIPYCKILSTSVIWGIWMAAVGDLLTAQLSHTFSPQYIRNYLGYSLAHTGFYAAVPVLIQFLVKIFAGLSSDKFTCISETNKLRVYNSLALGVSALFLIVLAFVPYNSGWPGMIALIAATAAFGFNGGGFNKCSTLVARQYSEFVLGVVQFIWCLSMLVSPLVVHAILDDVKSESEWRLIYLLHAGILLTANGIFCLFATNQPAAWTNDDASTGSNQ